jgi:acyl-coenzyme A thioesterase PaaI-like protein
MSEPLTAEQQHRRRQAVRDLMTTTPFVGGLGIVFERYEPDDVAIRLPSAKSSPTTACISTVG